MHGHLWISIYMVIVCQVTSKKATLIESYSQLRDKVGGAVVISRGKAPWLLVLRILRVRSLLMGLSHFELS